MTMRDLRLRALDAGPGRLVVTLGRRRARSTRSKLARAGAEVEGPLRLTPDMKLVAKTAENVKGEALIGAAKSLLVSR